MIRRFKSGSGKWNLPMLWNHAKSLWGPQASSPIRTYHLTWKTVRFPRRKNHRIHVEPQFQLHGHIRVGEHILERKIGDDKKILVHPWDGLVLYCTTVHWQKSYTNWRAYRVFAVTKGYLFSSLVQGKVGSVGKNSGHFGQMGSSDSEAEGDLCWNSKETKQASNSKETNRFWLLEGFDFRCLICDSWMNQWEGLSRWFSSKEAVDQSSQIPCLCVVDQQGKSHESPINRFRICLWKSSIS